MSLTRGALTVRMIKFPTLAVRPVFSLSKSDGLVQASSRRVTSKLNELMTYRMSAGNNLSHIY